MRDAFRVGDVEHELWLSRSAVHEYRLHLEYSEHHVGLNARGDTGVATLMIDGHAVPVWYARRGDDVYVHVDGTTLTLTHCHPLKRVAGQSHDVTADVVRAPMPGSAVTVDVEAGQAVTRGQTLLVMESMKMETTIAASHDGVIESVHVTVGQPFEKDSILIRFAAGAHS
jgi:acetyl/propionyl-CoA carboxylase alpha subunit